MKVDKTVEVAKQALAANKCVVIGLQSTGEARLQVAHVPPTATPNSTQHRATFG